MVEHDRGADFYYPNGRLVVAVTRQAAFTRLELKMTSYVRVIGVDVSSKKLDISDSKGELSVVIDNTAEAIKSKLAKKISGAESTLVVCESSGGWEDLMVDLLHEANVDVAVVNPRQTHHYAKAHGYLEKTDTIDAKIIRHFGEHIEVHLTKPRTQVRNRFKRYLVDECKS